VLEKDCTLSNSVERSRVKNVFVVILTLKSIAVASPIGNI